MTEPGDPKRQTQSSDSAASPTRMGTQRELADFAAHELRGPVHTLQAFLSILLRDQAGPLNEIQRDLVSSMFFITRRLERLTDDIHVLLAEGKGFSVDMQEVDILSIAEDCRRELVPVSEGQDVTLRIEANESNEWKTWSDPVRVTQVMINLLENAVRHASSKTAVTLRLRQSPSRMLIVIQNEAIHPPSGNIGHWFEPYVRGHRAEERAPRGLGLGLAIVSQLVAALEGQIFTRTREQEVTIAVCLPHTVTANVQV